MDWLLANFVLINVLLINLNALMVLMKKKSLIIVGYVVVNKLFFLSFNLFPKNKSSFLPILAKKLRK
ncbi:hypothetical protein BJ944DRAFT_273035 [Cunninghamella echinulata]|nr:hypothetical protein BJ944DRAFT_273035 [Cunninghamella echinulata]